MAFYTKVAVLSFCLGAGMEYFMIRTGFYDKCGFLLMDGVALCRLMSSMECVQGCGD